MHIRFLLFALPLLAAASTAAAQDSPVGTWTTIDDDTGKPKSVVEIYEAGDGSLSGRVSEVLQSDRGPDPLCDACPGDRKGQPIEGMVILWDIREDDGVWEGGRILDPSSGKVYSVKAEPVDGGEKLQVRGFIGFSLLGRTQTWLRR